MPALGRIQPEAVDAPDEGLRLGQRGEAFVLAQMAQEAHDQPPRDAPAPRPFGEAVLQPPEHRGKRDAPGRVGLGVEEDLGVDNAIRRGPLEVGQHQVVEVGPGAQHVGAGIIEVEERLQAVEGIGSPQRRLVGVGKHDAVAARQRKGQAGLQAALDVDVELGLRHAEGQIKRISAAHDQSPRGNEPQS